LTVSQTIFVKNKDLTPVIPIIMDSIVEKLIKNTKQIRTLEQLRDMLLPKLVSGEVRVKEFNN